MIRRIIVADTQEELDTMYSADVQRADLVVVRDSQVGAVVRYRKLQPGEQWQTLIDLLLTLR